ncbi:MAG: hypothetical protein NTY19_27225 [Planctomycetota bacterium]|nr:hypothetical protein [Planctomycetota bacterium]
MKQAITLFIALLLVPWAAFDLSVANAQEQPGAASARPAPSAPVPTYADVSFGPHPHQLLDIYLPKKKESVK